MVRIYKYWNNVNMGNTEDFYVRYKIELTEWNRIKCEVVDNKKRAKLEVGIYRY